MASCSNYLPVCSPSSGAACKRGVVLTLPASGFSKPVAGRRFCEAGFQNSFDTRRAAEMRCGHGPTAGTSERKVFANRASAYKAMTQSKRTGRDDQNRKDRDEEKTRHPREDPARDRCRAEKHRYKI